LIVQNVLPNGAHVPHSVVCNCDVLVCVEITVRSQRALVSPQ